MEVDVRTYRVFAALAVNHGCYIGLSMLAPYISRFFMGARQKGQVSNQN